MKKLLVAVAIGAMLLCSGCDVFFPGPASSEPSSAPSQETPPKYRAEYENKWCFQRLSESLRDCYEALYEAVMDSRWTDSTVTVYKEDTGEDMDAAEETFPGVRITLPHYLESEQDAQLLYQAFTWDNPQFFFLSNNYYYEGYHNDKTGNIVCRSLCLPYTMPASERRRLDDELNQVIDGYLKQLPSGDDFAVELFLHDRMLKNCEYHTLAGETHDYEKYPGAFTAVGALVDGQAVCEGYARGMQLLLQRAGLDCSLVTGTNENNDPHMWNLVTVNGRNYHLDPTWDDVNEQVRHTFFNITTDSITRTHTIDSDVIGVDTCSATQDNYYRRTGHYIDTFEREKIAAVIAQDMAAGEAMIDLQFDPPKFVNGQLLVSNRELLLRLVGEQLTVPDAMLWTDYDMGVNETYYTITLYKK